MFLLAYRASIDETTGVTFANIVFGREPHLPRPDIRGSPGQRTIDDGLYRRLVKRTKDINHFALKHMKVASDRMKARYDQLAKSAAFQLGDRIWE